MMKVVLSILFICLSAHNLFASGESSRKRELPRRWTGDEDARLRSAVERMGKAVSWSKISESAFGRSRTSRQCRQRWSNHLDPLLDHNLFASGESSRKRELPRRWTGEEDAQLRSAVERMGKAVSWREISERTFGGTRSERQCHHRWCNNLNPALDHEPFTPSEREALRKKVLEEGRRDWSGIARELFPSKGGLRVRNLGWSILKSSEMRSEYVGASAEQAHEPSPIHRMPTPSAESIREGRAKMPQRKRELHEVSHEADEDPGQPESAIKRPIMEDDQGQESAVSLVSLEPPSLVEEQLQEFLISGGQRSESGVHHGYRNQSPELPEYHVAVVDEYSQESPQSPCSDGALGELDFE